MSWDFLTPFCPHLSQVRPAVIFRGRLLLRRPPPPPPRPPPPSHRPRPGSPVKGPQPRTNPGCLDLVLHPNLLQRLSLGAHSPANPTTISTSPASLVGERREEYVAQGLVRRKKVVDAGGSIAGHLYCLYAHVNLWRGPHKMTP